MGVLFESLGTLVHQRFGFGRGVTTSFILGGKAVGYGSLGQTKALCSA